MPTPEPKFEHEHPTSPGINTKDDTRLSFTVTGFDIDPDKITELIGLEPDEVGRKSDVPDPKRRPGFKLKENYWKLKSSLPEDARPEVHLDHLLSVLMPHEEAIAKLSAQYHAELSYYYWTTDWTPGMWFEPNQLAQVARLGVHLDFDLYVSPDDADEPIRRHFFKRALGEQGSSSLVFDSDTAIDILDWAEDQGITLWGINTVNFANNEWSVFTADWLGFEPIPSDHKADYKAAKDFVHEHTKTGTGFTFEMSRNADGTNDEPTSANNNP